jgi:heat shock protein HslJ
MKLNLQLGLSIVFIFAAACSSKAQPEPGTPTLEATEEKETMTVEQESTPVAEDVQVDAGHLSPEDLRNATYSGIYDEPITLDNGFIEQTLEGQPFTVEYQDGRELYGDLDGDGVEDALVFLIERGGGTAVFTYIAAQLNQNSQPVDAGAIMVEDRTQIISETIADGQVMLDITTYGPGDVACCPSHKTSRTYALESGRLADTSPEDQDLVRISADDLNGTSWTLFELNDDVPPLADSEVTISFQGNQISGSGGCNNYNSGFSLGEDNPFMMTVEPIAATKKACPDAILDQENAYFKILESVSLWGYDHGQLVLFYVDDQGNYSRLLFAPQDTGGVSRVIPASEAGLETANIVKDDNGHAVDNGEKNTPAGKKLPTSISRW